MGLIKELFLTSVFVVGLSVVASAAVFIATFVCLNFFAYLASQSLSEMFATYGGSEQSRNIEFLFLMLYQIVSTTLCFSLRGGPYILLSFLGAEGLALSLQLLYYMFTIWSSTLFYTQFCIGFALLIGLASVSLILETEDDYIKDPFVLTKGISYYGSIWLLVNLAVIGGIALLG
mmetsp:Transcript_30204/g.53495  ORF Transcript_30204/g.53495 Transcript_30204/m.53495 type:complete len:175 (+) Transcript_30204:54-578(+)